ncbi:MAG: DNA-binding protein [Prevotella sp.]|nr:DNA-binding protein [Prevotella sp.]
MRRLVLSFIIYHLALSLAEAQKPWTFWYWMYGAVSEAGIKADLQAMKDVGLGGCYLMPIRGTEQAPKDLPPLPGEPAQQLSPRFWQLIDYAMQQADSLGLEFGFHICDGFALAGGPWITAEESMQQVVWSDTIIGVNSQGLSPFNTEGVLYPQLCKVPEALLPAPAVSPGAYYEDIATFVCPVWGDAIASTPALSGTIKPDEKGTFRATQPGYIQFTYNSPVTVRSVELFPSANNIQTQRLLVQASTDDSGTSFRDVRQLTPPRQGWQNTNTAIPLRHNANHYTYSLPETTARHFRFVWTPEGSEPGAEDLDAAKWSPVLKMNDIRLSAQPVIDQYESLNGSFWRRLLSDECLVLSDISPKAKQASLNTQHSALNKVRILRIGHASTGHTNATAGGARGLECDKFSAAAVSKQVDSWFGAFMQRPHSSVVKYMHVDSWECGSQNWSRNFAAEFQKRRGYDLLPFLPVYAGVPIDAMPEAKALGISSEQVLRDVRLTVNDLIQDIFFATVAGKARQYGVSLSAESVAPTMVSDGMQHYKAVDVPMGEFWLNSPTHDKPNDMLDAISGAHVYGKNIVQAEGFTEVRGVWDETPASLKTLLDRQLASGMNRLFFHVFAHNPWTDRKPGMTLDGIGLFFQRDQTWMPEAKAFVDYVTRCQQLLQRGTPVVDIAVYTGDGMPRRAWRPEQLVDMLPGLIGSERVAAEHERLANAGQPMEESPVGVKHSANIADPAAWVNALGGYNFDSMNPDALMAYGSYESYGSYETYKSYGSYKSHKTHESHKTSAPPCYPVLVMPPGLQLSPETKARADELRKQGVIVIDEPLHDSAIAGLPPDVQLPTGIAFCHRRDGAKDIYFLSNQQDEERRFTATFRCASKNVMFYDPLRNRYFIDVNDVISSDSLTAVYVRMEPRQSLFVLFGEDSIRPKLTARWHQPMMGPDMPKTVFKWKTKGWQLSFKENGVKLKSDTLFSWASHKKPEVRYYSGHVRYSTTLDYHGENVMNRVVLDLGDVRDMAHVWLNGHDLGVLWLPPYTVDVDGYLREGKNELVVEVVNTWHNALRGADRGTPPYNGIWTNAKYRTKGDDLLPAGLLGPVKLSMEY